MSEMPSPFDVLRADIELIRRLPETLQGIEASLGDYFILDANDEPRPASLGQYLAWAHTRPRPWVVAVERVGLGYVSTVFLGVNHGGSLGSARDPIVYQTLVFGGPLDGYGVRHRGLSRRAARAAHRAFVRALLVQTRPMAQKLGRLAARRRR